MWIKWGCRVKVFTVLTTNLPKVESSFLAIKNYNKYWFWVQDVKFGHMFLAILLISNRDRSRYGFLQITCCSRVTYVDKKNIALKADFPFSIRIESNKDLLLHTVESMIVSLWRKMIYFTSVLYHLSEPWNNQPSFVFWSRNIYMARWWPN